MIWAYAVCDRPELPPPRRCGLEQAPLEGVVEGRLLAVVSRHEHPPREPSLDALMAHERVVEWLMAERAVLPLRFGTSLPDADALRAAVAARHDRLLAALDHVRGRVELAVRAMQSTGGTPAPPQAPAPASPAPTATTGRDYVLAKLADARRAERAAAELHEPLAALAVDARRRRPQGADELLRGSYLVENDAVAGFRGAVERLQRDHLQIALVCTGPWPPYSFVGQAGDDAERARAGAPR